MLLNNYFCLSIFVLIFSFYCNEVTACDKNDFIKASELRIKINGMGTQGKDDLLSEYSEVANRLVENCNSLVGLNFLHNYFDSQEEYCNAWKIRAKYPKLINSSKLGDVNINTNVVIGSKSLSNSGLNCLKTNEGRDRGELVKFLKENIAESSSIIFKHSKSRYHRIGDLKTVRGVLLGNWLDSFFFVDIIPKIKRDDVAKSIINNERVSNEWELFLDYSREHIKNDHLKYKSEVKEISKQIKIINQELTK